MYEPYGHGHSVARAIETGSQWFHAWIVQYCLPYPRLAKAGILPERAQALSNDAPITAAEVNALAAACDVQPADILASIPPHLKVETPPAGSSCRGREGCRANSRGDSLPCIGSTTKGRAGSKVWQ